MRGQTPELLLADQQLGWVGRLPPGLRDLAMLARWDRPIGTWLLLLPCWWGQALAPGLPDPWFAFLFAVGAVAMRGAGCTINDLFDRDFDRKVARTANRPLAAGRVSVPRALAFAAAQSLVGLLVLLQLPAPAVLVGLASVPLIVVYPLMKRITFWPQAVLGVTFNWGVLVGYVATTGTVDLSMLLLYAAGIAWTLGYDTIYAHQDKEDDRVVGVRSTALLFGERTMPWLFGFYAAFVLLLAAAAALAGKGAGFWLFLPLVGWSLVRQLHRLDLDDPEDCIRRFRMNRLTGLLVTAALVAGELGRTIGG
ncbi:MAG: 4-hydroxybenzoate octaprenyltransferase [Geminicoccaceae bacterium]|nr:4-hydroxybenzoate octaprenyltransferase [Geminicoccaceae bacterium]MDW8123872.1 4-hydroxybenzoate octaprenyltransferase [Geminicoccaceae bacterium]